VSLYQRNMAVLRACSPAYADWVETAPPDPRLEIIPTASGRPDLRIMSASGDKFLLYDSDDPPQAVRTDLQNFDFKKTRVAIIFGLGLGYQTAALLDAAPPDQVVFVVEENPALVKLALHVVDLTRHLAFQRLVFVRPEEESLAELGRKMGWKTFSGSINFLVEEQSRKIFSPGFVDRLERFTRRLQQKNQSRSAWTKAAVQVVDNSLANLPLILLSPSVARLKNVLKGTPAIVVSAGPSLKAGAAKLARAKGRAAVIATAPVLRVLSAYGVKPDLVGVLDYTPANYEVLRHVYNEDAPLVFLDQACPALVRDYQGKLISVLQTQGPLQRWLGPHLTGHAHWSVGGNVGSFCLDLALYLGADPIILVGQDLAFPDLTSHSEGVVGRRTISEQAHSLQQVWLESVGGGRVLSDLTLASYLEEFKQTAASAGRTIINTSPHGARIPATIEMELNQALDRYCRQEHDFDALIRPAFHEPSQGLEKVLAEMAGSVQELEALEVVVKECLDLNRRLAELMGRTGGTESPEFLNLSRTQARYSHKVWEYCRNFEPLRVCLTPQSAGLSDEKRIAQPSKNPLQNHLAALERNRVMMSAAGQAAGRLHHQISEAMKKLSEFLKAERALTQGPISAAEHRALGKIWMDLGRSSRAWGHYCQALKLEPNEEDVIIEAAQLALAREDLDQALTLARRLLTLSTKKMEAERLLSQIEDQRQTWLDQARAALAADDWVTAWLLARKVLTAEPDHLEAREIQNRCRQLRADSSKTNELVDGLKAKASLRAGWR